MKTITLSTDEHGIVMTSLNASIERLRKYVADTEALAPTERRFPTDQPEKWRAELAKYEALYERLAS